MVRSTWVKRFFLIALAIALPFLFIPAASADTTAATQTNTSTGNVATTACSTSVSFTFTVPNAGDWVLVGMGAKTATRVADPTDSQGNTYTLDAAAAGGGSLTGRWAGLWRTQAASAGSNTISWACAADPHMAGSLIGTFTAAGGNHQLTPDVWGGNYWNNSTTGLDPSFGLTANASDLEVDFGFNREATNVSDSDSVLKAYLWANGGSGQPSSGTAFYGHNANTGSPTWAAGSSVTHSLGFSLASGSGGAYGAGILVAYKTS